MDYTCKICGRPNSSVTQLSWHLQLGHNKMKMQYYREEVLKLPKGKCKVCGKPTAYISLDKGYKIYCSTKCGKQDPDAKAKTMQHNLETLGVAWPMQSKDIQEKSKQSYKAKTGYEFPGQNPDVKQKIEESSLIKYGVKSPNQSDIVKRNKREAIQLKYNVDNISQLEEIKAKKILTNLKNNGTKFGFDTAMADPEFRSSVVAKGKFPITEKKINEFLTNRNFDFKHNYNINEKCFDFVIFKDSKPVLAIESDGIFYHGLKSDYDGIKVRQHLTRDYERFAILPEDCKLLVVDDETKFEYIAAEIMRVVDMDYESWIKDIISNLPIDFPYPSFSRDRILKDYEKLCLYDYLKGQALGMSIINQFHKSIWSAHLYNCISPVEAWKDPVLLEKCVRNRAIYRSVLSSQNIARGFAISKIAPKVSVFNPSIARYLLLKYGDITQDTKIVCDPFSGFSGRMLGACSLGLKYLGYDIDPVHVKESNDIISYLNLDAKVYLDDITKATIIQGDICLTCPPYNIKEIWGTPLENKSCDEWIDITLKKVKAKSYIFVVDKTQFYKDNIVEVLEAKSHLSSVKEYVIKF